MKVIIFVYLIFTVALLYASFAWAWFFVWGAMLSLFANTIKNSRDDVL